MDKNGPKESLISNFNGEYGYWSNNSNFNVDYCSIYFVHFQPSIFFINIYFYFRNQIISVIILNISCYLHVSLYSPVGDGDPENDL